MTVEKMKEVITVHAKSPLVGFQYQLLLEETLRNACKNEVTEEQDLPVFNHVSLLPSRVLKQPCGSTCSASGEPSRGRNRCLNIDPPRFAMVT